MRFDGSTNGIASSDLTQIPFQELALQTTLLFSPIGQTVCMSYLQAVAEHEGVQVSATYTQSLAYATRNSLQKNSLIDRPLPPGLHRLQEGSDLRAAILQLQAEVSLKKTIDMCM